MRTRFATAAAPPAALFAAYGIDLAPALHELRAELPIAPLPDALIGPMAPRIMQGGHAAGLDWQKLDKMIRPSICRSGCWRCAYGYPCGAKWTARDFLDEAVRDGATLLDQARVKRVPIENGQAVGVEFVRDGAVQEARARVVVLSGGGVGSPRLLHNSGLAPRTSGFFSDPVISVMGTVDDIEGGAEVPMAAGVRFDADGISLADMTLPAPMYPGLHAAGGPCGPAVRASPYLVDHGEGARRNWRGDRTEVGQQAAACERSGEARLRRGDGARGAAWRRSDTRFSEPPFCGPSRWERADRRRRR